MKKWLGIMFMLLCAADATAADSQFDTYYEFGRRGAQAIVDEEDLSDEFYYGQYNVKFAEKLKDSSSYDVRYQYYYKDYDNLENIDNNFNTAGLGIDTPIYSYGDMAVRVAPDIELKKKTYQDSKNLDYNQVKLDLPLTFRKEKDWSVKLKGGINSYDYLNSPRDQFKLNISLNASKKFFDERLDLSASYRFQYVIRQKIADRMERTCGASAGLKLDSPFVKRLEAGLTNGMDNTIIYEEREDSFDYKYLSWHLKSEHAFLDRIETYLKYTNLSRVYADFNHNFNGFTIENPWDLDVFETKDIDFDLKLAYVHKQVRYPYVSSPFSFHNDNILSGCEFAMKNNWIFALGSDFKFYNYPAISRNDKIYYIERLSLEKLLLKKDLKLGFDYKYTFKNFLHRMDVTESVYRFRVSYRF